MQEEEANTNFTAHMVAYAANRQAEMAGSQHELNNTEISVPFRATFLFILSTGSRYNTRLCLLLHFSSFWPAEQPPPPPPPPDPKIGRTPYISCNKAVLLFIQL